jgi:hypothetical protein
MDGATSADCTFASLSLQLPHGSHDHALDRFPRIIFSGMAICEDVLEDGR